MTANTQCREVFFPPDLQLNDADRIGFVAETTEGPAVCLVAISDPPQNRLLLRESPGEARLNNTSQLVFAEPGQIILREPSGSLMELAVASCKPGGKELSQWGSVLIPD